MDNCTLPDDDQIRIEEIEAELRQLKGTRAKSKKRTRDSQGCGPLLSEEQLVSCLMREEELRMHSSKVQKDFELAEVDRFVAPPFQTRILILQCCIPAIRRF
jgi:hypothetical protein